MTVTRTELREALTAAYLESGLLLGREMTDAMAFPAYLRGNRLSRYVFHRKLDLVVRAAELGPGARVLDFGCGSGILLPRLCERGCIVKATDLDLRPARMVADRLGFTQVEFIASQYWEQSVPDAEIDAIIVANVLEHIEDRRRLLAAFARKLSTSGRLVVSSPTENSIYKLGRWIVGFSGDYHVANVYDVLSDIRAAGFRLDCLRRWPLPGCGCLYVIAAFLRPIA